MAGITTGLAVAGTTLEDGFGSPPQAAQISGKPNIIPLSFVM
jgi:hypothetical protein